MRATSAQLLLAAAVGSAVACSPAEPPAAREPQASGVQGWFREVGSELGLSFVYEPGAAGGLHLPEIVGGGVALVDLDGDGDLDAYFANGSFALSEASTTPVNHLFLQNQDGRFVDATEAAGLGDPGYGLGIATGDVDNDGDVDVYVANYGRDALYRNTAAGHFENVTDAAGIRVEGFSCSAVFCDYDVDGFLDLYVTQYVRYDPHQVCADSSGRPDYCSPKAFNPASDVLLHNEGDGTFTDVSARAGLRTVAAAGLGVVCEDFDGDGRPDFYVANDQYPNNLWINRGDGRFVDQALLRGAAYNLEGRAEAGMGVIAADLDNDLDLDLYMTHLPTESNTMYRNLGGGLFEDASGRLGLAQSSLPYTGFGTVAFDAELDGDLDILVANGRVLRGKPDPRANVPPPWNAYAEPNLFYLNTGTRFEDGGPAGRSFTEPFEVSRGLAIGDIDGDGDIDVLLSNTGSPARLYRNEAPRRGSWLAVRAIDPRWQRDAIGAQLTLIGSRQRMFRTVTTGFSYLSSSDPVVHFGFDDSNRIERLEVQWPDGMRETFDVPGVDRTLRVVRGDGGQAS